MKENFFKICVAGTHSGSGKTTVTLGLLASFARRGLRLQPFKCGPDYLDTEYHRHACGVVSRNLDTWMMGAEGVRQSFARAARNSDGAVVEGVMGLFDGAFAQSAEGSTAHVAEILSLPILLVIDAKSMARSAAALVKGFISFMPELNIIGVIANNVGSERHRNLLRDALESSGLPPLLGALPKNDAWRIPERHLGLTSVTETAPPKSWFDALADAVEQNCDLDRILKLSSVKLSADATISKIGNDTEVYPKRLARLGVALDDAFHFYYEDNLDALREAGAELVFFSPLADQDLPPKLNGLYLGGGFPEVFAEKLAQNVKMRSAIKKFADGGGTIYAECGGFMYLCRSLRDAQGREHEMCGVFPATTRMENKRHRLGYMQARLKEDGLFGPSGTLWRGHEFHWSSLQDVDSGAKNFCEASKPSESENHSESLRVGNAFGTYIHAHFASNLKMAEAFVKNLKPTRR